MTTTTTTKSRSRSKKQETIADRAMLVDLTVRQWTAAKNDKKISDEVAQNHNSDGDMGHYYKRLIGREALKDIQRIANAAFNEHYIYTLPWLDSGSRILSSVGYFEYMEKMRDWKVQYDAAVDTFVANYNDYVEEAKDRLNGLFREDDYPKAREIRSKFAFNVTILPLPVAGDFRVKLGTEEMKLVQANIEASTQEVLRKTIQECCLRIKVVVEHMFERLQAYNGSPAGSFRDTLVTNVMEMANLIPILNVTADPRLEEIANEMKSVLCLYDPQTLRSDEAARASTAAAAQEILDKMEAFI